MKKEQKKTKAMIELKDITTLSQETKDLLIDNAISCWFNEETGKYECHYPSDNYEYYASEEELLDNVRDYIAFWEGNHD